MLQFLISFLLIFNISLVGASSIGESIKKEDIKTLKSLLSQSSLKSKKIQKNPLFIAVTTEKPKVVEWLLKNNKVSVNIATRTLRTPLHLAAFKLNYKIVKLLLDHGASVNKIDSRGFNPLHYALQRNILKPNTNKKEVLRITQLLTQKNKKLLNQKNKIGETPLHLASFSGYDETVSFLLKKKVLINARDKEGYTALHQVVLGAKQFKKIKNLKENYKKVISNLSQHSSILNIRDKKGRVALHYIAEQGKDKFAEVLLSAKAKPNVQDNKGWTPLFLASANSHIPVMQSLVQHGADVNIKDKEGMTALYLAVGSGDKKAVALLLQSKSAIFLQDAKGDSFFDNKTKKKLKTLLDQFYKK